MTVGNNKKKLNYYLVKHITRKKIRKWKGKSTRPKDQIYFNKTRLLLEWWWYNMRMR